MRHAATPQAEATRAAPRGATATTLIRLRMRAASIMLIRYAAEAMIHVVYAQDASAP